jgi:hypothetical protein
LPLLRRLRQIALEAQRAGEHPLDITVQDGGALAKAEGGDGRGRGRADAGQAGQRLAVGRESPAMLGHHGLCAAVQVARPAVIAQPAPQRQHLVQGCGRQGLHVRKALQEAAVVTQHGGHLGLLQHDLGQPHAVRVARTLPGQAVPAVLALPGHHARGQARLGTRGAQRFWHEGQK